MEKKKIKSKSVHKYKKGTKTHLDMIYGIQGLAGGDWWDREDSEDDISDSIIITRNVHFEIIVYETK